MGETVEPAPPMDEKGMEQPAGGDHDYGQNDHPEIGQQPLEKGPDLGEQRLYLGGREAIGDHPGNKQP